MRLSMDSFDHVEQPLLRDLIGYWMAAARERDMPARRDIDPAEIPRLLPFVWLCDYLPDSRRFRYRLMGDHVRDAYDSNATGRYLDEMVSPGAKDRVLYYFRKAVDLPCVVHIHGRLYAEAKTPAQGERILLPLSADGVHVDMILGATVHSWIGGVRRTLPAGEQVRTFTPIDGSPAFQDRPVG